MIQKQANQANLNKKSYLLLPSMMMKSGDIKMKRQTRNVCLCFIFIAINLIAICVSSIQAEHHHHEEPKHKFHPYKYGYKVIDHKGNKQWKQEESHTPMEVKGSYGYKDKHGLFREVSYIADKHGFRAKIRTNELHGKVKNPANVEIISEPSYHGGGGHGGGHHAASQVQPVQAAPRPQPARLPMPMSVAAAAQPATAVPNVAAAAAHQQQHQRQHQQSEQQPEEEDQQL